MSKFIATPINLTTFVKINLFIDTENFPSFVTSVYGQKLPIKDEDENWEKYINFEHLAYKNLKFKWGICFNANPYFEWMLRWFCINRFTTYLGWLPVKDIVDVFKNFDIEAVDPIQFSLQFHKKIKILLKDLQVCKKYSAIQGCKLFYQWALDEGIEGFDDEKFSSIESLTRVPYKKSTLVSLRDMDDGPYTSIEMALINNAIIKNSNVSNRLKAMYFIFRDWGLRPIQLALLMPSDYGRDSLGPYIKVVGVKGNKRSKWRRSENNFTKRYISEDTEEALLKQISEASLQCESVIKKYDQIILGKCLRKRPEIPIFPTLNKNLDRLEIFARNKILSNYIFCSDSCNISREFNKLRDILSISTIRSDNRYISPKILKITAYRFRRTKGTSLVLAGHSIDEVAMALDHQSTSSVVNYFSYSKDVQENIDSAALNSFEIKQAIEMWEGKFSEELSNVDGLRTIGSLGLCTRKSLCPHHPTVSCYSCGSFRPSMNADHENSLRTLNLYVKEIENHSTDGLKNKLISETSGAINLIKAIKYIKSNEK